MGNVTHATAAVGVDSGDDLISKNAWDEAHTVPTGSIVKNNFGATTNPAVTDDSGDGYEVGSRWVNVSTDSAFTCLDATVGGAVWQPGGGSSFVNPMTTAGDMIYTIGGEDLALGKTATSGGSAVTPQNAVDGDEGTNADLNFETFLSVDLVSALSVASFRIKQSPNPSSWYIAAYKIQSSDNSTDWTDRHVIATGAAEDSGVVVLDGGPITARYWRFFCVTQTGPRIYTFSLFAATQPDRLATTTYGRTLLAKTALPSGVSFVIDGASAVIEAGFKGFFEVPFAGTITAVRLLADQSGSIVVDLWKDTYANYPPVNADSITASAPPTLSAAAKSQDTTLTGWTTAVAAGDIIGVNVDSATTVQRVTLVLLIARS